MYVVVNNLISAAAGYSEPNHLKVIKIVENICVCKVFDKKLSSCTQSAATVMLPYHGIRKNAANRNCFHNEILTDKFY